MTNEEEEVVPVCPDCDHTTVRNRVRNPGWYCKTCGASFEEPKYRESNRYAGAPGGLSEAGWAALRWEPNKEEEK